jgi:UDP-glucose 4-epimerase
MKILVTGGAGYIGSHTVVELLKDGHEVVVVDNLVNSNERVFSRLEEITGKKVKSYAIDVANKQALLTVFDENKFDAVIHFAGLKAVGESVAEPLLYYRNNLDSTISLLEVMVEKDVKQIVFSSSATVYGDPENIPISEDAALHPTNPYGQTKLMIEQILRDLVVPNREFRVTILRYFNPVGAHPSGLIGEDPQGLPNNLMPFISRVAAGRIDKLKIYGDDYPTADGTGVRDYLHVVDLARAHVDAIEHAPEPGQVVTYNLGTGKGYTVLEVLASFERAVGHEIPHEIIARRPGDVAAVYAEPSKAERELGWRAEKTLDDMCSDAWNWQSKNPDGYGEK